MPNSQTKTQSSNTHKAPATEPTINTLKQTKASKQQQTIIPHYQQPTTKIKTQQKQQPQTKYNRKAAS